MRLGLQLILFLTLSTSLWAQEDQINHTYELVLAMDEIPDGFIGIPTSIVRTPDRKYMIVCHSYGDSKVGVYRLSDGERVQSFQLKGDEHFLNYFFEGENVFIDGKRHLTKINYMTGERSTFKSQENGPDSFYARFPRNTARAHFELHLNPSRITISVAGRFIIKTLDKKIYLYYSK